MLKKVFNSFLKDKKGEINMIAIVLIIIVVIILAAIFKEGLISVLNSVFKRVQNDILNLK